MSTTPPELQDLIAAYLAGRASAEETARLSELVRTDAAARDAYLEAADVHAALTVDETLWPAATAGEKARPTPRPAAPPRRRWRLLELAAVLLACATLAGLWLTHKLGRAPADGTSTEQGPTLAVLTRAIELEWGEAPSAADSPAGTQGAGAAAATSPAARGGRPTEGAELRAGAVRLRRGTAQLDFYGGARLIVAGPADLVLRSAREAHLARGKVTCEVGVQGRGFRLTAPGMEVMDLGTVFGLKVPEHGAPEIHVLEGRVSAVVVGGGAAEVREAQAVRLGGGVLTPIAFASQEFTRSSELRQLGDAESARRFAAWRVSAAALDGDPAVLTHLTFDGEDADHGGVARNRAQGPARGSDGLVIGAQRAEGRWPGKRALEFRGYGDRVLLRVPGGRGSLTLAAWLRVDAYRQQVTGLLMTEEPWRWPGPAPAAPAAGEPDGAYSSLRWELRHDGQLALNWFRAVSPDHGDWLTHWADTGLTPDHLGAWTLLATVVDEERREVAHYRDGRLLARRPADPATRPALARLCLGNLSATEAEARAGIRYAFLGRMDEVLIAARAFSPAEIAGLYESGRP